MAARVGRPAPDRRAQRLQAPLDGAVRDEAQLTLEERLLVQAQEDAAPRLAPDVAAKLLGADQAELEAQLHAQAQQAREAQARAASAQDTQAQQARQAQGAALNAGSGLRLDQKTALWHALTSGRRVEVLVGPAG